MCVEEGGGWLRGGVVSLKFRFLGPRKEYFRINSPLSFNIEHNFYENFKPVCGFVTYLFPYLQGKACFACYSIMRLPNVVFVYLSTKEAGISSNSFWNETVIIQSEFCKYMLLFTCNI